MGNVTGFLEIDRQDRRSRPASDRIRNYREFYVPLSEEGCKDQAARCMDCGIPYCHTGCPVNNQIPDWNDLVYRGDWAEACRNLHSTNNFPEFTGRICPAPCEASCTLNIIDSPVTIKTIECAIVDRGWQEGWILPEPSAAKTGKKVAIVGAGSAGMACAQQLARTGHDVHLFDRHDKPGGLLRYGIPDFKMEKHHIDRRVAQMEAEGVTFHTNVHVGHDVRAKELVEGHDAVVLTGGAEQSRDLPVEGRELDGIHFAMDFLPQQNRRVGDEPLGEVEPILAGGKNLVHGCRVIIGVGQDILARVEVQAKLVQHAFQHRMNEAHGEQNKIGAQFEFAAGDRLKIFIGAHAMQLFDRAVLAGKALRQDGKFAFGAFLLA